MVERIGPSCPILLIEIAIFLMLTIMLASHSLEIKGGEKQVGE